MRAIAPCVLIGARLFTGEAFLDGHALLLGTDGRIAGLMPESEVPAGMPRRDLPAGALLAPGFVDVQVNGGGGVLFNDTTSAAGIAAIAASHRRFGTTGLLPTFITDRPGTMAGAVAATREAIAAGVPGVLGVHLEGPFLNPARKGVHDPALIRLPEEADIAVMTSLGVGRTLVTVAPERVPPALIRRLADAGLIVSAGHTEARYDQVRAALDHGLRGFTHLFNAMPPIAGREPGPVGAALDDDASWCGLIVDGYHVHPATLRLAIAAKRRGQSILVTDAMPPVGADGPFMLYGQTVSVVDGRCTTPDGTLAGSALDMASAVRNTVGMLGLELAEALRMASTYPAEFLRLGHEIGRLVPGLRADLVLLDSGLQVLGTWIGGRED